jgi:Fe2+ transport system protein FeoA
MLDLEFMDAPASELAMSAHTAECTTAERSVSLATLGPGSVAVILDVDRASPEGRRLLDLGFVPDTEVRVLKRAPLGDPMVYFLRGTHLCLRRTEADRVRVRLV